MKERNSHKGQLSIFIILGILALFIIILFLVSKSSTTLYEEINQNPTNAPEYIRLCLYNSALETYLKLGFYGGYINLPSLDYISGTLNYPSYSLKAKSEITQDAKNNIKLLFSACIDKVNQKPQGFTIKLKDPKVEIRYKDGIEIEMTNVGAIQEKSRIKLTENSQIKLDFNFEKVYDIAELINQHKQSNPDTELSFVDNPPKDTIIEVLKSSTNQIYIISDTSTKVERYDFIMPYD